VERLTVAGSRAVKQVGGGEPATVGQRRAGGRQLGVRGAAMSSGGGRCNDGGARRWCSTGRRSRQMKEVGGSVLQQFLAEDGGSEVHKSGARWPALGAWSRGGRREAE
jgi:hypothetical protein